MKKQTITHLTKSSLADRRFLLHPEWAEWNKSGSSGDIYDAAGKKGLRVVCTSCGTVLEEVPLSSASAYARCPDCGGQGFFIWEFRKEKRPSVTRQTAVPSQEGKPAAPASPTPVPTSSGSPAPAPLTTPEGAPASTQPSYTFRDLVDTLFAIISFFIACVVIAAVTILVFHSLIRLLEKLI